jgi:WD40 repeat protein
MSNGDEFGYSVSLSNNGNSLAIGASDGNYAHVYSINEGDEPSWLLLGETIEGEAPDDWFEFSMSLSRDGNILAVGAPYNTNNAGHVRIFRLEETDGLKWAQIGENIDGDTTGKYWGWSVSLSSDGMTVAMGSPYGGLVRVYCVDKDWTRWQQLGQTIEGEVGDMSGESVSLSADGNVIAIGAPDNDNDNGIMSGRVRFYYMDDDSSSWLRVGRDIDGEEAYDELGYSVSLAADGKTVAIGA